MEPRARVAVVGATGYIGARLVPRLLDAGHDVRCLVRSPRKLDERPGRRHDGVEVAAVDLEDRAAVTGALRGVWRRVLPRARDAVGRSRLRRRDRTMAQVMAGACGDAGVERLVYLGGLGRDSGRLSEHLASRRELAWGDAVGFWRVAPSNHPRSSPCAPRCACPATPCSSSASRPPPTAAAPS
ncbi:MAG: NAD(P)H-binding protein [Acidobacteria bacterium]|nr:NAD(P)H-binding protein [Acidobacteriota bacterium]